jgi:RHS repeat-associated protein
LPVGALHFRCGPAGRLRITARSSGGALLGKARTTTQTVPQPYRFQGTYLDPTGLYKMGARYYDPTLGRFTQTDPSGKETNPYLAFGADPVDHTDPNGTLSLGDVFNIKDAYQALSDGLNGDTRALLGDLAGAVTGVLVESACNFVIGYTEVPTGGLSTLAEPACTIGAAYAGDYAASLVSG